MLKVTAMVHTIVAPTIMGMLVVVALVVPGYGTGFWIAVAAVVGLIGSVPVSILVARKILHLTGPA